ncbi:von Willebrand factor A-like protein [Gracilaria domingensis]|nr:von Willebrand factor A-like protein [Gracilaria domingensis]
MQCDQAVQVDSVNMLCSAKVQANAESSVGLLTLAGRSARILVTSTRDLGRIFTCMHDVQFDGEANFMAGIQKAQLALKHRQNSLQRQRIVVFVSSPLSAEVEALVKLGKSLKKNSVSVDVINIGLEGENQSKIDAFIDSVNSNDNSRALHVPAGGPNLADALMNSDIYMERESGGGGGAGGGTGDGAANNFPYGVDPAEDPELAMVLRISMEEERARQARAAQEAAESGADGATNEGDNKDSGSASKGKYDDNDEDLYGTGENMDVDNDEDAEMLRRAIELSKATAEPTNGSSSDKKDDDDKKESS